MNVIADCVVDCRRLPSPVAATVPAIFFRISVPSPSDTFILFCKLVPAPVSTGQASAIK